MIRPIISTGRQLIINPNEPGIFIPRSSSADDWVLFDSDDFTGVDSAEVTQTDGSRAYDDGGNPAPRIPIHLDNTMAYSGTEGFHHRRFTVNSLTHAIEAQWDNSDGLNPDYPVILTCRFEDMDNFIVARWHKDVDPDRIDLWKRIAGVWTELGSYNTAFVDGDRLRLDVIHNGPGDVDAYVKLNDATVILVTGIADLPETEKVGVAIYYSGSKIDNMRCWTVP
jgi:hypothetical protein